jgi:hypothetical protein
MAPTLRHIPIAVLALGSTLAVRAEDPDPRADLQATQMALDRAVAEVSQPSVHFVLGGREATRAYRLKGVGAFFVLPPRALPTGERERVFVFNRRAPRGLVPKLSKDQERELRAMQMQLEAMNREAEAMNLEAERALESVERNVRIRLEAPSPPQAPEAPRPPVAPRPPEALVAAEAPEAPLPPPWHFWFGTSETTDDRPPDRIVADVQGAVTAVLEAVGGRLRTVPADESLLVAVDFLPPRGFDLEEPLGPVRSLIVKVKKRDLTDRSAGKISAEELRRRIEYTQY